MTAADSSLESFQDSVRKSGLIADTQFAEYLRKHGPVTSARQLAAHMIRDALLTNYQARMLLDGKHRGFVSNNKYRVLELLAVGGMGAIYLCEHTLMRRLVAMKVLSRDQNLPAGAADRFLREARAAASLDHPNLVRAYDLDRLSGGHCLIMEFVDGVSLQSLVEKGGALHPITAAEYIAQAAAGLYHAHQAWLVHRDIKPANILISRQGVIKVLDLGLARFYTDSADNLTRQHSANAILGTADYISPEQASAADQVDTRADIYSLGCTLYYLLTGRPPFDKGTAAHKLMWHQTQDFDPIENINPTVPQGLITILNRMVAKRPQDRYSDLRACVEDLRPYLTAPVPPPDEREFPPLCPLVRNLLTEYNKGQPTAVTTGWQSLSTRELLLPPGQTGDTGSEIRSAIRPAGGADSSRIRSATIDLSAAPTWRGRRTASDTNDLMSTGTLATGRSNGAKKSGRKPLAPALLTGLIGGALLVVVFAAYQANRPDAVVPASASKKSR